MTAELLILLLGLCFVPMPEADFVRYAAEICAHQYEIDPAYLWCIGQKESDWNPRAYNRAEGAAGLFQWKKEPWRVARRAMGANPDLNLRFDPIENIVTTCYAMQRGWQWWVNADALCKAYVDKNAGLE